VLAAAVTAGAATAVGPVEYRIVRFDVEFSTDVSGPGGSMPHPVLGLGARDRYASAAFGLNNDGLVVGMANVDIFSPPFGLLGVESQPFVWQPASIHAAFGVNTMHPLASAPASISCKAGLHGAAFDVNAEGDVVGIARRCDGSSASPYRAFVWSPDTGLGHAASTLIELDGFGTAGFESAGAASITDRIGVGEATTATAVGWRTSPLESPHRFDVRPLSATALDVLPPPGTEFYEIGRATGINPDISVTDRIAGGLVENSAELSPCSVEAGLLPSRWTGTSLTVLPFVHQPAPVTFNGVARDSNDAGFVVGYVGVDETADCERRAAYWPATMSLQLQLFAANPAGSEDSTVAVATNAFGETVGQNEFAQTAIRWSVPTQYVDLNDVADCVSCDIEALESAHDINDDGWIVGVARVVDEEEVGVVNRIGVLLVPLGSCPADVDRDGDVGATDLALVQTATGACPPRAICWRDVNGDCRVDGQDVQIVLQYLRTQACATTETLAAPLAAMWLAAGGEQFLASDLEAPVLVAAAYEAESQLDTFVNLMGIIE
jgi:hypothetical protein